MILNSATTLEIDTTWWLHNLSFDHSATARIQNRIISALGVSSKTLSTNSQASRLDGPRFDYEGTSMIAITQK